MAISKDEMTAIATEAVEQAFTRMGISHKDPTEMQRDMAFLRDSRKRHDSVVGKIFTWGLTGTVIGGAVLAWRDALAHIIKGGQ